MRVPMAKHKKKKTMQRTNRTKKPARSKKRSARVVRKNKTHAKKHVHVEKKGKKPARARSMRAPEGSGKQHVKVEALITLGRERGYITYDEILREFPTIEDNVLLLEDMYERFGAAGIDVLEGGGMLEDSSADTVLEKKKLQHRRA